MTFAVGGDYLRRVRLLSRVLALLALASPCSAASLLYLSSESVDEPVASGRRIRVSGPATDFHFHPTDDGGLYFWVTDPAPAWGQYYVYFVPVPGLRFAPGPWDGAADCGSSPAPGVCVGRNGGYQPVVGHIDVIDAAYDAGGHLVRFAASFWQQGASPGTRLTGAVRFASGDDACSGADPGAPCDDLDACSAVSTCVDGVCTPSMTVDCPGPAAGGCHDAPTCDPGNGACALPSTWADGISCQPDDRCFIAGYCASGVCSENLVPDSCDDYDPCTYDDCDTGHGCRYPPIAGACGRAGVPTAYLFVRSTPPRGGPVFLTPPNLGVFNDANGAVSVVASDAQHQTWEVAFTPPPGMTMVPGTYDDVTADTLRPGRAALSFFTNAHRCDRPVGRFVVHEITTHLMEGDRGRSLAFAADFELRCTDGTTMSGAVRTRVGDATCVGAPDGTPCDDLNACTATSACRDGSCVGADPVVCPPGEACHAAPVCDPTTGACLDGPPLLDGVTCEDATKCLHGGTCANGTCFADRDPCDDANPCTLDRCDGKGGCVHDAFPGCWLTESQSTLVASAHGSVHGRDVHCGTVRCQRVDRGIQLLSDGVYRTPGGETTCADGATMTLPDEVGTLRPTRSGKLRLHPSNRREIHRALRRCRRRNLAVSSHETIELSSDGHDLTGVTRAHVTIFDTLPVEESIVSRLRGRLGAPPDPVELPPGANVCPDRILLRCTAD